MHHTCRRVRRPSISAVHWLIVLPVRPRKVRIARLHQVLTIKTSCPYVFKACSTGRCGAGPPLNSVCQCCIPRPFTLCHRNVVSHPVICTSAICVS